MNIQEFLCRVDKYKKCYFWTPNMNAAGRRKAEFNDKLKITLNKRKYVITQSLDISCKNYYYSHTITRDGVKTNLTALKSDYRKSR